MAFNSGKKCDPFKRLSSLSLPGDHHQFDDNNVMDRCVLLHAHVTSKVFSPNLNKTFLDFS